MVYPAASGPVRALDDITFEVGQGEFIALVGPSGCGKSTLLRIVAGLRPATAGAVTVDSRPVTRPIRAVGMVFQAPVLLKWRSVLDNVLLPAELSGLSRSAYRSRAEDLLRLVGSGISRRSFPGSCQAACNSARRSAGPSSSIRRCSSWTSPSARSTP